MNTLLINGCSFGECWNPSDQFVSDLGCDSVENISKQATSFQRTCRTTVEWIAQNGDPHFVIIPITFAHRWELAIAQNDDPLDGAWFPLQRKDLLNSTKHTLATEVDKEKLALMMDLYYGNIPTIKTYWDKVFTEVVLLSAFLKSRNIRHIMFDMCNNFDRKHIKGYKGFIKTTLIESNKNIIDLFSFCGNKYMWQNMPDNERTDYNIHHAPEQYRTLETYLSHYLQQHLK